MARGLKPTARNSRQPSPAAFRKIVASGISTISVSHASVKPKLRPKPGNTDGCLQRLLARVGPDMM